MAKKMTLPQAIKCIREDIPEHYPAAKVLLAFAEEQARLIYDEGDFGTLEQYRANDVRAGKLITAARMAGLGAFLATRRG